MLIGLLSRRPLRLMLSANREVADGRAPWRKLSACGVLVGAICFAASLTPSLLPRGFVTQGVLSGISLVVGYGVGAAAHWLWAYVELPEPQDGIRRFARLAVVAAGTLVAVVSLWRAAAWQNSIRKLMGLEAVDTGYPLEVVLIALMVFAVLMTLARLFQATFRVAQARIRRFLPRRLSNVIGILAVAALFWSIGNGILFRVGLRAAAISFEEYDRLIPPGTGPPVDPLKTGSHASLLAWEGLGRWGREFIASGPSRDDIGGFSGRKALQPLRVYVGLRSAGTLEARARLALAELKRVGGFERSVLVVVSPTGTGWVDPAALDSVEYLHGGDVASVALQYSYLASWLYLLVDPGYGANASRALFKEIYGYWTALPEDRRPKLYLFGLSLGATNSERSTDLIEVIGDPFTGALWSGPPHSSRLWRFLTDHRDPKSPAWLPRFRDGSFVRFVNQYGDSATQASMSNAAWGPMRVVYLQYASDPVTFFDYGTFHREPEWMQPPRGPDVSRQLRWYPIVTFLQLGLDMIMATSAPIGFGHLYAPAHYVDAWIEVTDAQGWSADEIVRLKQHLSRRLCNPSKGKTFAFYETTPAH
jgi:uncharacterized membrane protein